MVKDLILEAGKARSKVTHYATIVANLALCGHQGRQGFVRADAGMKLPMCSMCLTVQARAEAKVSESTKASQ